MALLLIYLLQVEMQLQILWAYCTIRKHYNKLGDTDLGCWSDLWLIII